MLEVWWIRHAQSEWNRESRWQGHSDPPLSSLGEEQSRQLGERLASEKFDQVHSSDLSRTLRTVELALPQAEVRADQRLREIAFGQFEGKTHAELDPEAREVFYRWFLDPYGSRLPGGESLSDLSDRLEGWFGGLPGHGRVAVFTHGGVIRCSLWRITGPPEAGQWTIQLDNASITRVVYAKDYACLVTVNQTSHLEPR